VITILPNFVLGPVAGPGATGVSTGFMKEFLEAPGGKVRVGEGRGAGASVARRKIRESPAPAESWVRLRQWDTWLQHHSSGMRQLPSPLS
jgi:hypothetical protein